MISDLTSEYEIKVEKTTFIYDYEITLMHNKKYLARCSLFCKDNNLEILEFKKCVGNTDEYGGCASILMDFVFLYSKSKKCNSLVGTFKPVPDLEKDAYRFYYKNGFEYKDKRLCFKLSNEDRNITDYYDCINENESNKEHYYKPKNKIELKKIIEEFYVLSNLVCGVTMFIKDSEGGCTEMKFNNLQGVDEYISNESRGFIKNNNSNDFDVQNCILLLTMDDALNNFYSSENHCFGYIKVGYYSNETSSYKISLDTFHKEIKPRICKYNIDSYIKKCKLYVNKANGVICDLQLSFNQNKFDISIYENNMHDKKETLKHINEILKTNIILDKFDSANFSLEKLNMLDKMGLYFAKRKGEEEVFLIGKNIEITYENRN